MRLLASNLTDEEYWSSYIDESVNVVTHRPGGIQAAGRKVGLQLSWSF